MTEFTKPIYKVVIFPGTDNEDELDEDFATEDEAYRAAEEWASAPELYDQYRSVDMTYEIVDICSLKE